MMWPRDGAELELMWPLRWPFPADLIVMQK